MSTLGELDHKLAASSHSPTPFGTPTTSAKLVLYSTAPVLQDEPVFDAFEAIGGSEARTVAERYFTRRTEATTAEFRHVCLPLYHQVPKDPTWMARSVGNLDVSIQFFEGEGKTFDFRPHLNCINCPTLVGDGAKDPRCPPVLTRRFADGIRADLLRLVMFDACGQGPHIEEPERAIVVQQDFYRRNVIASVDRLRYSLLGKRPAFLSHSGTRSPGLACGPAG
jgi:pimeloyl-ACP methyl ester carboxylesterase